MAAACVSDKFIDDFLGCLLLAKNFDHGLLERLLFLFHLQADLQALDLGLRGDHLVEVHEPSANSGNQVIVSDEDFQDFTPDEVLSGLQFDDRQDQTKNIVKLLVRQQVNESLETFLFFILRVLNTFIVILIRC